MAAFQTELTTLGAAKAKAEARFVETEAAFADTRAEKQVDIDAMQTRLQELTQEVERTKAQPDPRDERAAPHSALILSASAGDAELGNSSVKAAAIRNALLAGVAPGEIVRPQDLERLPGIGPIYERRLYAAGIGTFWEFASCPDEELLEALGLEGAHEVRVTASKARTEAYRLAEKTETVGMLWGGRQADGA